VKIGIGAATYIANDEHFRMARETYESARTREHELVWTFGATHIAPQYRAWFEERGEVWDTSENNVSMAWNGCIKRLLDQGCRYVLVPNLDILFKSNCIDRLVAYAEAHPEYILITAGPTGDENVESAIDDENVSEHPAFSLFLVDQRLIDRVGWFDEEFHGAYDEDLDMHYRIKLAGETAVVYGGARFWHVGSGTIRYDGQLSNIIQQAHWQNDRYFERKWGYKPLTANPEHTQGMYLVPFNGLTR
jgi:GT2 family glycosyltransferase